MTLDTPRVAATMTLGDRHLKPAHSQLDGALDRGPSPVEREGKKSGDSSEGGEGGESRGEQGQLSLVTPLQLAVAISPSLLLKVFFSPS